MRKNPDTIDTRELYEFMAKTAQMIENMNKNFELQVRLFKEYREDFKEHKEAQIDLFQTIKDNVADIAASFKHLRCPLTEEVLENSKYIQKQKGEKVIVYGVFAAIWAGTIGVIIKKLFGGN